MRVKFARRSLEKKMELELVVSSVLFDAKILDIHDVREVDKWEGLFMYGYHAFVELCGHCTFLGDSLLLRVMLFSRGGKCLKKGYCW